MHKYNSTFILVCAAFVLGGLAIVSNIASISTDYWLFMCEELPFQYFVENNALENDNMTDLKNNNFPVKIEVKSKMGLWRFCTIAEGSESCERFEQTTHKRTYQEISLSIAESQIETGPIFLTSLVFIIGSTIFNIVGNLRWNHFTVVSGISYMTAELCIVVGLVLYITKVQREVHPDTIDRNIKFTYSYGFSFYSMLLCLVATLSAAFVCIHIFYRNWKQTRTLKSMEMQLSTETNDDATRHNSSL